MSIFTQFIKSLYSPKDIAKFRFQGIGKTILYLFFLSFLSALPSLILMNTEIVQGIKAGREILKTELPPFEIKDGTLKTSKDEPYTTEKGSFTFIMDDTGSIKAEDIEAKSEGTIALLEKEFVFTGGGRSQSYPYSMAGGVTIDNDSAAGTLQSVQKLSFILLPVLSLVVYLASSAVLFFEVTLIAVAGLLAARLLKRKLQYRHLFRLTGYSITLITVFFTIMDSFMAFMYYRSALIWGVTLVILYLSIREIPAPKQKPRA
ncbi:DUF1189 domain-containing protein [Peribacillus sp. SCS-37]|uniref:DUF1189 domain-containing protein n=1 Tax=Paraperibacillus esterisolvens TaxID=3115296 RepID=UPI003905E93B